MKKSILFALTLMLAIFFISCNNDTASDNKLAATDANGEDNESVKAQIRKEDSNFEEEFKKGDSTALAAHYTSDAVAMPPNSEAVKANNIVNLWGGVIRMGVKELKLDITDVSGSGDIYAETGTLEIFGADKKSLDKGKYIIIVKLIQIFRK